MLHYAKLFYKEAYVKREEIETAQKRVSYWHDHIQSWEQAGLSQRDYCKANSLALSTFSYWRKKLGKNSTTRPRFYPLAVVPDFSAGNKETTARLRLNFSKGRFQVEIQDDFSEPALQRLILTLEQL